MRLQLERVTIWALSGENLARPSEQLEGLFDVVADKLNALATLHRGHSLQIRVVGRHRDLPARLRMAIEAVEMATAANSGLRLTIAVGYSGRDELVDAARSLVRRLIDDHTPPARIADFITREELARHLYGR